mgnify:CR=1 FL=1
MNLISEIILIYMLIIYLTYGRISCLSRISAILSWEICPSCGHLWNSFISEIEMMSFLIILHSICSKHWVPFIWIISEFAWGVNSFLNIDILARKLFNFTFYSILHEMLRLVSLWHLLAIIKSIRTAILVWKWHFLLFLECILTHRRNMIGSWQIWWRLHANSTSWVPDSTKLGHILHFIIILRSSTMVLYSRITSAICQTLVHYLSTFSLILDTSYLFT